MSVGKRFSVLFEKPGKHKGQWAGKSPYMQSVLVESAHNPCGKLIDVEVTAAYANSLAATVTEDEYSHRAAG